MGKKFCVLCGREDVPLIGSLCIDCYIKTKDLVNIPQVIEGKYCKICGSTWINGKWHSPEVDPIEDIINAEISKRLRLDDNVKEYRFSINRIWNEEGRSFAEIKFDGKVFDRKFSVTKVVYLRITQTICDRCIKRKSHYYEALIQLRSKDPSNIKDKIKMFESFFSNEVINNLSDVVERPEGKDYYFINKTIAKRLISAFTNVVDAEIKESIEGERMKKGKKTGKLVISIRV
ncbi:MAG: 60S ribosomal export protein NMD3 [Sulfolobaceae archaeon]|nr:60S ribosomal export protein NMD3 [Sulfolobaceae archaeon]